MLVMIMVYLRPLVPSVEVIVSTLRALWCVIRRVARRIVGPSRQGGCEGIWKGAIKVSALFLSGPWIDDVAPLAIDASSRNVVHLWCRNERMGLYR